MWVLCGPFSMFSNFYRLDLHNTSCIVLANLRRRICKKQIGNWTSHALVMVMGSACFDFFDRCMGPPNCVHY